MSVETIFPKNKIVYNHSIKKIILLVNKPIDKKIWNILEVRWTLTESKNSYLITPDFLHRNYIQRGNILENCNNNIQNFNININMLNHGDYEIRAYVKFGMDLNDNKILEKCCLTSFSILNTEKKYTVNKKQSPEQLCFNNHCVTMKSDKRS